jgi:2-octaprenyl-6-methoxyphenol hydroxylase
MPKAHDSVHIHAPVIVVGCGPAGLASAILLADAGVPVILAGRAGGNDPRTAALMEQAVGVLRQLGVWESICPHAGALRVMRLVDATRRLLRAPDVVFRASEMGLEAFGYNIPTQKLVDALAVRAARSTSLDWIQADVTAVECGTGDVRLKFEDGRIERAKLVVGADGARSPSRQAAGISATVTPLQQTAFVVNARHTLPHDGISTEFHTEHGPFTLVPLPGLRSSIVAVGRPADAEAMMAMDDAELGEVLTRRSAGILGVLTPEGARGVRPLSHLEVGTMAQGRVILVGEAGHVLPPIGAQGLNLGLRDAAAMMALVAKSYAAGGDTGGVEVTSAYARARKSDVAGRSMAVRLFNQSLLSPLLPVQAARTCGLGALKRLPPLRRLAMKAGLGS